MRILGQTGGATQFIELVQASIEVKKVFDFTDLVVTSASAIASLPFVIGMYEELIEEGENLEVKDFMKVSPTNSKGGFSWRAIFRAIRSFLPFTKVNSFGVQDVSKLLKKYVTPEVFQQYKEGNYPNIHVYYVDPDTKTPCIENAKNCTYQEFIDLVQTSSKIQPMVEHGIFRDKPGVDGGMYLSGAVGYFIEEGYFEKEEVEEVYSIYVWTNPNPKPDSKWKNNIATNIKGAIDSFKAGGKWAFPRHEYWFCKANNIPLTQLFCPDLHDTTYDLDSLKENGLKTKEVVKKQLAGKILLSKDEK